MDRSCRNRHERGARAGAEFCCGFLQGKTVTLQVGSKSDGGYDVVARVVSRYMSKYIPGQPQIVAQFVPGDGSLRLANRLASGGTPNDGTIIGLSSNDMPTTPLLSADVVKLDPAFFLPPGVPVDRGARPSGSGYA